MSMRVYTYKGRDKGQGTLLRPDKGAHLPLVLVREGDVKTHRDAVGEAISGVKVAESAARGGARPT